ncbi:hypothetical protein BC828DRAFT_428577 [Blastocladiella britannica]|nr:hypothetical protein BC828DRAFT_428577 [Blastocladiella britannica]
MAQQSFISFHDLTPDGSYLYATPSVQQVLGYHPSEMVGRSAYDFFFPAEIPACKALHLETISLQKVAVVTTLRMRHRAGHFVKASIVSNLISGCIVATREMTSQEVHVIEANGVVVSKQWSRHRLQPAPAEPARWADAVAAFSEIRSCLLLDRFTAGLTCVYATASLADVLETPGAPDAIINRSILDWIHPQCRESVMTEVGRAKSMDGICHVRFATIGAVYGGADVEVEVVMQCCSDAILAIVRPFANQV